MATDKRQFTMRMESETFEKVRFLAFCDRRSMAMEIEHILWDYIERYEKENGEIIVPNV